MAGCLSDRGEYHYEYQNIHAGDEIEAETGGAAEKYTVIAVVGVPNSMQMSYSRGGYENIVFAEPVFLEKFSDMQTPIHCLFDAEEGKPAVVTAAVCVLLAAGISAGTDRVWNKGSIVEQLREIA